jgi:steroid 5-alpha reductase family enzyme
MRGWQLAGLISPLFVFFLITRVSGIPILEKRADEKWGDMQDYEKYKSSTPVLLPFPPKIKK